ncbi:hypothetical protein ACQWU4_04100 [Chryseobacterium sp. MIQD13]
MYSNCFCCTVFADHKEGSPPELPSRTGQKKYVSICVPVKALKPQWIVHSIVPYHDTLYVKSSLEKDDCRKTEQHEIKTAWDSTISVIEALVYLTHR